MTTKHPNWRCPGCGEVMYYLGACHHAYGCDDHPGCEKYQEAKYRASGMWPLDGHPCIDRSRLAWSARSLNKAVDAWRMMLAYGVERRELSHNVAASMKKAPRVRREMATYTPDEIRRVLRATDKSRSGHLWYLALSGLRRGEIAGLRWSDIDFASGTITIARNRVQAGAANVVENEPKTLSRVARCRWTRGWSACSSAPQHATPRRGCRSVKRTPTAGMWR